LKFSKNDVTPAVFLLFVALLFLPIAIHYAIGPFPVLGNLWVVEALPKIEWDFQRMHSIYGLHAANDFKQYFVINILVSTSAFFLFLGNFIYQSRHGEFETGVGFTKESGRKGEVGEFLTAKILWCVFVTVTLGLPSLIAPDNKWGVFNIQPGIRSQILVSTWFLFTSYVSAALVGAFIDNRKHNKAEQ